MKRFNYRYLCLILFVLLIFCGCDKSSETMKNTKDDRFHVVTSFYPIYIMAWNLTDGVEGVELSNMAKPSTGCLHDYQLRPRDLICLDGADLFLINGAGMEDFLSDVLEAYPELSICQAVDALNEEDFILEDEHDGHNEHDEQDEYDGHDEHDDEHEHGDWNPHTWLDPVLYRKELLYFKKALIANDPTHRDQYEENYRIYDAKIEKLQEMYPWKSMYGFDKSSDNLEKQQEISVFILHESFPYILRTCGIHLAGSADVEKDSGFSAKEIRELVDTAHECDTRYILSDNQYSGRISDLLAEETGMKVWKLDSCVSGEFEKDSYLNAMTYNYETIRQGMKEDKKAMTQKTMQGGETDGNQI